MNFKQFSNLITKNFDKEYIENIYDDIKTDFSLLENIKISILFSIYESLFNIENYTPYEISLFEKYGYLHELLINFCKSPQNIRNIEYYNIVNDYGQILYLDEYINKLLLLDNNVRN